MADSSFAPVDLPPPRTIDVAPFTNDLPPPPRILHRNSSYVNPFGGVSSAAVDDVTGWGSPENKITWMKVLSVLTISLSTNMIILTLYIFLWTEPKGTAATCAAAAAASNTNNWAPLPGSDQVLTSIAFGSCNSQHMPQGHWDTLVKFKPDLVVLTGDNVYGDCQNDTCATLKQAYTDWAAHPSFIGAKSQLPIVATLDDHDYGKGDCHADNPYKDTAKELFLDFFDIHDERRDSDRGVYHSYKWGTGDQVVQLILLDTRYNRSPFLKSDQPGAQGKEVYMPDVFDSTGNTQMLSPQQWTWLEEQLEEEANVRLVVSSIQVLSDAHGFECWRMLPHEQERLQKVIREKAQPNSATVLISGDRHVGGIYETEGLVELTASSWTHTIPLGAFNDCDSAFSCDEHDVIRVDDLVRVNNFGSVQIDWETRELNLSLRMADGTAAYHYRYPKKDDQITDAGSVLQSFSYAIP